MSEINSPLIYCRDSFQFKLYCLSRSRESELGLFYRFLDLALKRSYIFFSLVIISINVRVLCRVTTYFKLHYYLNQLG